MFRFKKPRFNFYSDPCSHCCGTLNSSPSCAVCCSPPNIILFMPKSSSPFFFFCLFLFCSFPSLQILPVKNTGEKMRGRKWRRAKSLRGEGPIKRGPVPSTECAQRWSKMKEVKKRRRRKKKKNRLSILSKDRFLSYSERRANREAGWGLDWGRERTEGGGQVVSNTKADERKSFGRIDSVMEARCTQTAKNPARFSRFKSLFHTCLKCYLLRGSPYWLTSTTRAS